MVVLRGHRERIRSELVGLRAPAQVRRWHLEVGQGWGWWGTARVERRGAREQDEAISASQHVVPPLRAFVFLS